MSSVRTRIAPSPTGGLHIGHIRTVLYDYALAKKYNGKFVLRIEDTDQKRYVPGAVEKLIDLLKDYGLMWDEGPVVGGPYEPYVQSQRLDIYKKHALELIEKGDAYYCFMDETETKELQERSRLEKRKLRSPYRDMDKSSVDELLKSGKTYVIRLKVPENEIIKFNDEVLGEVKYNSNEVDDQVLLKSDGFPTYHLAVVVDDHLMNITHVLRGNDWLPSTPKHILLYKYFGWDVPKFAHLPNLKEKDSGKKLSKRFGAVFASQFLEAGYLPDAILNLLMLVGWSSPEERIFGEKEKEIYSLDEFINLFDLNRIQKTALVSFDRDKLIWFNKEYIKRKSDVELSTIFINWVDKYAEDKTLLLDYRHDNTLAVKLSLTKERSSTLIELKDQIRFFYTKPLNIDWDNDKTKDFKDKVNDIVIDIKKILEGYDDNTSLWNQENWVNDMKGLSTKYGLKGGDSFMVLRMCIVGSPFSPPLFEAMQLMDKNEILERLKF